MPHAQGVAELQRRLRLALRIIEAIPSDRDRDFLFEIMTDYERLCRRPAADLAEREDAPIATYRLALI